MAYNASIPLATDLLSQTQADILANFMAIDSFVTVNHIGFNGENEGKHNFIQIPSSTTDPETISGEVGLFSRISLLTSEPELVFSHQDASTAYEFTSVKKNAIGYTMLPSGVILSWGYVSVAAGTTQTFTLASGTGITNLTTVYNALITPIGTSSVYLSEVTTTTISIYNPMSSDKSVYYLVIGV